MKWHDDVLRYTIEHGGGTFTMQGFPITFTKGFVVGLWDGTFRTVDIDDLEGFNESLNHVVADREWVFFGTWVHDGEIHIDPVQIIHGEELALYTAKARGQKAIFDLATGETINV